MIDLNRIELQAMRLRAAIIDYIKTNKSITNTILARMSKSHGLFERSTINYIEPNKLILTSFQEQCNYYVENILYGVKTDNEFYANEVLSKLIVSIGDFEE